MQTVSFKFLSLKYPTLREYISWCFASKGKEEMLDLLFGLELEDEQPHKGH